MMQLYAQHAQDCVDTLRQNESVLNRALAAFDDEEAQVDAELMRRK
jgi:hypothetical protein